MVVQILIPLLTILLSGLVATVVTHYLATSHQEKQFRRQKLEQLYFSMDGFCTWFVAFNAYWPGVMDGKIDYHTALNRQIEMGKDKNKNERPHQTAEMLVNIYFPALLPNFDAIVARRDSVNESFSAFRKQYKTSGPDASNRKFIAPFNQAMRDFDAEHSRFNHELFKIAKAIR
jgi:hypothetical protein